jgi:hypothetical protein
MMVLYSASSAIFIPPSAIPAIREGLEAPPLTSLSTSALVVLLSIEPLDYLKHLFCEKGEPREK